MRRTVLVILLAAAVLPHAGLGLVRRLALPKSVLQPVIGYARGVSETSGFSGWRASARHDDQAALCWIGLIVTLLSLAACSSSDLGLIASTGNRS